MYYGLGLNDSCLQNPDAQKWLHTGNLLRGLMDPDHISGPSQKSWDGSVDSVGSLLCSDAHPDLEREFRHRPRGQWPPVALINFIVQLPMILVLVGHRLSPDSSLQARVSFSLCELKLIQELPGVVKQGYIACKYVLKRFLVAHRCPNCAGDGRSLVGSYHIKTSLLNFLEKRPPALITSPFILFKDLLCELDSNLKMEKLPHYFLPECNLLETVDSVERGTARHVIQRILLDPLNALIYSPKYPRQIYGDVHPQGLAIAFRNMYAHPTNERCRKNLSALLACLDEWRQQKYSQQQRIDGESPKKYGRPQIIGLVDMLKEIINF